jgi:hypothetical protein
MCLLVCRRTVWWRSKDRPVARPRYTALRCVMGLLLQAERKRKERSSPVCSTRDQVHLSDEPGCRTAGCERGFYAKAVATRLQKARNRSAADTVRDRCRTNWHSTSVRVQAARLRLGSRDCNGSQASLNSDCQKTGESTFHLQQRGTLHATSSSTLSNSTNGWLTWQQRSLSEDARY